MKRKQSRPTRKKYAYIFIYILRTQRQLVEQDTQLLRRDRAMLRVIEYFAKSLKMTQGHSK